ncbi:MAG: hypothetical protein ACRCWQ_08275, partial [Bacilli bacterium]
PDSTGVSVAFLRTLQRCVDGRVKTLSSMGCEKGSLAVMVMFYEYYCNLVAGVAFVEISM